MTGIPVYNVNNNCSTGSTALFMAYQFIRGGQSDCVLALGFEKMKRGSLASVFNDRTNPMDRHGMAMVQMRGFDKKAPVAAQFFGNAGLEYMEKHGVSAATLAKIAEKNHRFSQHNPYAQFRSAHSLAEIEASPKIFGPLTKLQCCPTSEGAGTVIVASEEFVKRHNLQAQAIEIVMAMATDLPSTFESESCVDLVGFQMTKMAAAQAMREAGVTPNDVNVIELHDCFSANELISYEALGLCAEGKAGELVERGETDRGGRWPTNVSGGLLSKGHPLGATGLAQVSEVSWQLRNMTGQRQVPNCRVGLTHNIGLGGAAVVSVLRRGWPSVPLPKPPAFNPAVTSEEPPSAAL